MTQPIFIREQFLATKITRTTPPTDNMQCPICIEEYNTTTHQAAIFTDKSSCNHILCQTCLITWLDSPNTNTCALCKRQLFVLPEIEYSDNYEEYGEEDDYSDFDSDSESEYNSDAAYNSIHKYDSEEYDSASEDKDNGDDEFNEEEEEIIYISDDIIHGILEIVFIEIWWLHKWYSILPPPLRYADIPSPQTMLNVFSDTLDTQLQTHGIVDAMAEEQVTMLKWLLCHILAQLVEVGVVCAEFPEENAGDWEYILRGALGFF